jgi:ABC-type multidrug transport system fused ATPase/permease subunit
MEVINLDRELIIYGGLALLAIIIVISFIKKAVKLALFIVGIILVISLYNIFVKGVSPVDELNAYKTNLQYGKAITEYTVKIKTSTDIIKDIIESKKMDEASVNTLNAENAKLIQYQKEVSELKHTEKLNLFHDNYCGYIKTIASTAETATKLAGNGNKTLQGTEDIINKLKAGIDSLSELKLESK